MGTRGQWHNIPWYFLTTQWIWNDSNIGSSKWIFKKTVHWEATVKELYDSIKYCDCKWKNTAKLLNWKHTENIISYALFLSKRENARRFWR